MSVWEAQKLEICVILRGKKRIGAWVFFLNLQLRLSDRDRLDFLSPPKSRMEMDSLEHVDTTFGNGMYEVPQPDK